jgi:hypothetical protein
MEHATCKDGRPEGSNRLFHCTTIPILSIFWRWRQPGHYFPDGRNPITFFVGSASLGFRISNQPLNWNFDSRSAAWPLFRDVQISDVNTQPFYRQQLAGAQGRRRCGPPAAHQNFHHGA